MSTRRYMKRYIILFCTILLFNINVVKADNIYKCQYYDEVGISHLGNATYQFRYVVNSDDNTIFFEYIPANEREKNDYQPDSLNVLMDPIVDSDYSEEYYITKFEEIGEDVCQETVNICKLTVNRQGAEFPSVDRYGILFNSSLQTDIPSEMYMGKNDNGDYKLFPSFNLCQLSEEYKECSYTSYDENCVPFVFYDGDYNNKGTPANISYDCKRYSDKKEKTGLKDDVETKSKAYKDCEKKNGSGCSLEKLATEYNQSVEKLKGYCNNVIQNQNYGDACMNSCLGMFDDLKALEIEKTTEINECFLTDEIISFVYNVLKYAKYIAPVLAIILSILDFIKAIAASSEDDMKKAQGKFIKRLIVAALLFLVPLIINFLLQTFGVYNAKCDIGELFS